MKKIIYLFLFIIGSTFSITAYAKPSLNSMASQLSIERQQLIAEQANLAQFKKQIRQHILPQPSSQFYLNRRGEMRLLKNNLNAALNRIELTIATVKATSVTDDRTVLQQRLVVLNETKQVLIDRIKWLTLWQHNVKMNMWSMKLAKQKEALQVKMKKLQDEQRIYIQRAIAISRKMNTLNMTNANGMTENTNAQMQLLLLQEKMTVNRIALLLAQLHIQVNSLFYVDLVDVNSVSQLQKKRAVINAVLLSLDQANTVLQNKKNVYESLNHAIMNAALKNAFLVVEKQYQNQVSAMRLFHSQLEADRLNIDTLIHHVLSVRQLLPGFDVQDWSVILKNALQLPPLLLNQLHHFYVQVVERLQAFTILQFSLLLSLLFIFSAAWWYLHVYFKRLINLLSDKVRRFSQDVLMVLIEVVWGNLLALWLVIFLLVLKLLVNVDSSLWLALCAIYIVFRVAGLIARLLLLGINKENDSHIDVRLYHRLIGFFWVGGLITTVTMLAHHLPVSFSVRILLDRVFMCLMLLFSGLLFRAARTLPGVLEVAFAVKRQYIKRAIKLLCWLLPVTLLTNALMGLIGYVQLAWAVLAYQMLSLLVLLAYMVVRGLLIDLMDMLNEATIRYVKNGWLWSQAILKPAGHVFRITLFLSLVFFFFSLYHLNNSALVMHGLHGIWNTKLISFGEAAVTVNLLVYAFIFIMVLSWLARWSREVAFRWLYAKTVDVGQRHSLSIFTQYGVVVLGILFGLQLVGGLNLKGLAVIAAGLVAGIMFGARDILSNFFCGLMLLVERPFRTGDSITLGQYEGDVVSTGMRSLKIRTWDRMYVIVPNSDMFTKPFTNWTHQDCIVRTVATLKINRLDDPHKIQDIIYAVLNEFKAVVDSPRPEVFMKEISESLLELEVRYFINLQIEGSRPRVRSEVLFAIWDAFKQNGIKSPYPKYDIKIDNGSH